MADNYLITGYWGEPHVTQENDRGINAAMFGTGRFVLPVGEQFRAEYIGNNTIRMYDGKLMDNGAAAGIPVGEYVDLLIANAGQGMKRNDLIVFQYSKDASTLIESGVFTVIQGTETEGTASDPELTQEDLLSGNAGFDQMALWRVSVSGTAISAPVQVFSKVTPANTVENIASKITVKPSDNCSAARIDVAHKYGRMVQIRAHLTTANTALAAGDNVDATLEFDNPNHAPIDSMFSSVFLGTQIVGTRLAPGDLRGRLTAPTSASQGIYFTFTYICKGD